MRSPPPAARPSTAPASNAPRWPALKRRASTQTPRARDRLRRSSRACSDSQNRPYSSNQPCSRAGPPTRGHDADSSAGPHPSARAPRTLVSEHGKRRIARTRGRIGRIVELRRGIAPAGGETAGARFERANLRRSRRAAGAPQAIQERVILMAFPRHRGCAARSLALRKSSGVNFRFEYAASSASSRCARFRCRPQSRDDFLRWSLPAG